jgi:cysteine-rich repeat protein
MSSIIDLRPFALLLGVACSNHPDSALFSETGEPPASLGGSQSSTDPGTGATSGASTMADGGTPASSAGSSVGGAATTGGSAGVAGDASDPDPSTAGAATDPGNVPEPVCGDGKREGDEQCDDGAHEGEDGCSAECQVVCSDFDEDAQASEDHHCYAGYDDADFAGEEQACRERGAHLVTIGSAAENEIVNTFVNSSKFIGTFEDVALTSEMPGTYQWITGESMAFENWSGGQPDRAGARCNGYSNNPRCYEHCAFMRGDGTWADQRCDLTDGYVCEWEPAGN